MKKLLITLLGTVAIANVFAADNNCKTNPIASINTSLGNIQVQLDSKKAPASVANFQKYVNSGFYNGKIFHRVIPGFMIQGGGFDKDMVQATTNPPIKNEADNGLKNDKYTIAMARTSDVNSATSQFFINVADNTPLNFTSKTDSGYGYAVFGKVIKGTDVVDKIAATPTGSSNGYQDVPVTPITITKVTMLPCK
jgi:cyclophilin family peptidyl-prolyl cis-trans isomerase